MLFVWSAISLSNKYTVKDDIFQGADIFEIVLVLQKYYDSITPIFKMSKLIPSFPLLRNWKDTNELIQLISIQLIKLTSMNINTFYLTIIRLYI